MRRRFGAVGLLCTVVAVSAGAVAASGGGHAGPEATDATNRKPLRFEQHDLYIEYNATDGDAGLQLGADAESWKRFELLDTNARCSSI